MVSKKCNLVDNDNVDEGEAKSSNEKYGDKGTADFLTGLMQEHETLAWTLRRYFD